MIRLPATMVESPSTEDTKLLAELVAIDTTSSRSNVPAIDLACQRLQSPEIELIRMPVHEDKENLVAIVGTLDGSGEGLVLAGHLDCVPAGTGWTSDAFTLTERDGRLHARGACDMKGFDALAINLVREAAGQDLAHPLVLMLTCDEEVGGFGAKAIAESWPADRRLPTAAVIGEPTSLQVVRMHKGFLKLRLLITGENGHTGNPAIGHNAIGPMGRAIAALECVRGELLELRTQTSDAFGALGSPVLSLVGIDGGEAWNMTPDRCTLDIGLRLLPDQHRDEMIDRLRAELAVVLDGERWTLELVNETPSMMTSPDARLHQVACRLLGQTAEVGVSYGTDGAWLQRLGLECVVVGPGDIAVAHQPDEFMPCDEYSRGRTFMESLIEEFCT
jgi:acetylornithine deacetylase